MLKIIRIGWVLQKICWKHFGFLLGRYLYCLVLLMISAIYFPVNCVVCCGILDASFQWPETRLGPLEPKDHRFPLPGMVGSSTTHSATLNQSRQARVQQRPRYDADVLVAELPYERQSTAFEQFVAVNTEVWLDYFHILSFICRLTLYHDLHIE